MEETISTTVEAPEAQTTPEVTENTQPEQAQTTEEVTQESDSEAQETTESVEGEEKPQTEPKSETKDWEKRAKDTQASFTKVSQELAELKKQVEQSKPRLVEQGKINPQFEQQYNSERFIKNDALN